MVRFGPFTLDLESAQLTRGSEPLDVPPKVLDLLALLAEQPGRLHTREELLTALWPGVFVSDASLSQLLRRARQVLDDDARDPRWIQTVHRRGYRFIGEVRTPLSTPLSPFIGRTQELQTLREQWASGTRCTLLVGPGGIGKTRLALEHLTRTAADEWRGQVDLAEVHSVSELLGTVADALGIAVRPGTPEAAASQIGRALAGRSGGTLFLDNLEHTLPATRKTLDRWIRGTPELRWLLTSRVLLELEDLWVFEVPPLDPVDGHDLFRARAADAGSDLGQEHDSAIDAVVLAVDGNALAIELAAARTPLLDPEAIPRRLMRGLAVLGGSHQGPPRHRSARAAIAWSWELLTPVERRVLSQCALFAGGFTVLMAEALADPGVDTLEVLGALQRHSMLQRSRAQASPAAGRLRLTGTVRSYALEELTHDDPARDRFVRYYVDKARRIDVLAPRWETDVAHLGLDADSMRAAEAAAENLDDRALLACALGAWESSRGRWATARDRVAPYTDESAIDPELRDRCVLRSLSASEYLDPDHRARIPALAALLDRATERGDWPLIASAERILGRAHTQLGEHREGRDAQERSYRAGLRAKSDPLAAEACCRAGSNSLFLGEFDVAEDWVRRGLKRTSASNPLARASLLDLKGYLAAQQGRHAEAQHDMRQALALTEHTGDDGARINRYANLGSILQDALQFDEALEALDAAHALALAAGLRIPRAKILNNRALTRLHLGDLAAADDDLLTATALLGDGPTHLLGLFEMSAAALEGLRGRFDRCLHHAEAARDQVQGGWLSAGALMWCSVGRAALGDTQGAEHDLHSARTATSALPPMISAAFLPVEALIAHAAGDRAGAHELLGRVDHSMTFVRLVHGVAARAIQG